MVKLSERARLTSLDPAIACEAAMGRHTGHKDGQFTALTPPAPSYCHSKGLVRFLLYSNVFFLACNTLGKILNHERKNLLDVFTGMNTIRQGQLKLKSKLTWQVTVNITYYRTESNTQSLTGIHTHYTEHWITTSTLDYCIFT